MMAPRTRRWIRKRSAKTPPRSSDELASMPQPNAALTERSRPASAGGLLELALEPVEPDAHDDLERPLEQAVDADDGRQEDHRAVGLAHGPRPEPEHDEP